MEIRPRRSEAVAVAVEWIEKTSELGFRFEGFRRRFLFRYHLEASPLVLDGTTIVSILQSSLCLVVLHLKHHDAGGFFYTDRDERWTHSPFTS
ncbi:hypothetical protein V6N13_139120 [Hibiscus sabdariffa]